ncbi:acetyl-CoA carboxylase carboxyltransferase subunit alpha [Nannocystis punicea]|uniref:Acetyl-coenzyme A carboxylase carboxyl transferase subunit alpha n=1 Tax=Nannocystis punicea TaxID=2995304 RepID=A0ABY7HGD4_9BACT|nr:acetyl-CoA carboxylase carboxyltransferase subunit alpha [Nannocystis poenicansa]WAS98366.1 acetyl-CoA carboxylase carboxyltransferase subunit alpha [Nannocystis poenicansa]
MSGKVLEFERPIVELETKIRELKDLSSASGEMADEIAKLEQRAAELQRERFAALTPWEQLQLAKHPDRPYTLDYIGEILTDFVELKGDRAFGDDPAIVGGIARLDGRSVVVLGQQKGRNTKENLHRNFGMARPEGYRKAQRLMRMADQFGLPLLCLIDTAGAYPGIGAEERGQAEAIATCLELMAGLRVPSISVVIGEGGSGGALAIGVTDRILMLEHAVYSVISPRGCASILWKDAEAERTAAEQLKMTAQDLVGLGICDEVVPETLGGAHRGLPATAAALHDALRRHYGELAALSVQDRLERRYAKFRRMGHVEMQA